MGYLQTDFLILEPNVSVGIREYCPAEKSSKRGRTDIADRLEGLNLTSYWNDMVPFNKSLELGLKKVAIEAAIACPTGALSQKDKKR